MTMRGVRFVFSSTRTFFSGFVVSCWSGFFLLGRLLSPYAKRRRRAVSPSNPIPAHRLASSLSDIGIPFLVCLHRRLSRAHACQYGRADRVRV